jgi:hypothetical protein
MTEQLRMPLDFAFNWCMRGKVFRNSPPVAVRDFLAGRSVTALEERTSDLKVIMDDTCALLQWGSSTKQAVPIRQSFFDKLMRWHQFPLQILYRMKQDELLPLMNAALRLINNKVVIYMEDGEAQTIVSQNYARIADEELLDRIMRDDIEHITRTDHFIRITCREIKKVAVKPGDLVGVGSSIVNSETGFRALTVGWYLFRLVCSNGAIAPFSLYSERIYHQKRNNLGDQIDAALKSISEANAEEMFRVLTEAVKKPLPLRREVERMLVPLLGFRETRTMLDPSYDKKADQGLYDLFNVITWNAKNYPPSIQLAMEEFAGNMLWTGARHASALLPN